jgi:hypothetical protein
MRSVGYYLRSAADITEITSDQWKRIATSAKQEFHRSVNELRAERFLADSGHRYAGFESQDGRSVLVNRTYPEWGTEEKASELRKGTRMTVHKAGGE